MPISKKDFVLKAVAIIFIVMLFAAIRAFESALFYDPFLAYFKAEFKNVPFPELDLVKLGSNLFYRYFLNSMLSLALIYVIFRKADLIKFTSILYAFFFAILIVAFYFVLLCKGSESTWLLFYVRRFLIQPIFVLLFIPAFYYQFRVR